MRKFLAALLFFVSLYTSAATFTVSSTVYQPGTRDVGIPAGVLDTDTQVKAAFTRESWPTCEGPPTPCNVMEGKIYVSVNGGPQQFRCSFSAEGGDIFNRLGVLITVSSVECSLPSGTMRAVTVVLTNTVPLSTAMTVETKP